MGEGCQGFAAADFLDQLGIRKLAAATKRLTLFEVAQDDQVGLWVAGQVPHCPPEERPALVPLLLDAAIRDGLPRWTTQMSIEVTALVSRTTRCFDSSRSRSDTRDGLPSSPHPLEASRMAGGSGRSPKQTQAGRHGDATRR
jgi:hypothetical protein